MLVKIIFLYLSLGIIMFLVLRYNVQLFLLMFRRQRDAIYVPSFNRHLALMKTTLPLIRGRKLMDLGCGDGKAMRFFVRHYGVKCQGYDINTFAVNYGKVINLIRGYDISLRRKNFLSADIHEADYLYLYLFPGQMLDIEDRVFSHIKKGAIVISNTFQFKKHIPFEIIKDRKGKERIFLYKK